MLKKQPWMKGSYEIEIELSQAENEGKDISHLREKIQNIAGQQVKTPEIELQSNRIYEEIQTLPVRADYPYVEPDTLDEIKKQCHSSHSKESYDSDNLYDKVYGGWLGRCSGCLLGQPVEGWHREKIVSLLSETSNYPMKYYISSDLPEETRVKYGITDAGGPYGSKLKNWINNVEYMPEDDDTNYTAVGLKLIENYGPRFTPEDAAENWLQSLPLLKTCTAERIAYINLANLILPPESAVANNPYREWIGAQIRADIFGYVNPGDPETAADMAFRDASISHVKNGIYGEMFVAAMIATAFTSSDPVEIIREGLNRIPQKSRLYEKIRVMLDWHASDWTEQRVIDEIHMMYNEKNSHDWTHTISNAMLVTAGLLYGDMDFGKSIAIGTTSGFDTDCNSATIGSIVGVALGADKLPEKWTAPLNDTLKSGVDGFGMVNISELAKRTAAIVPGTTLE